MAWIETWAPYFATSVRRGGREYHEQGRVTLHPPVDGGPLRAWVRGPNKTHQVSIHAGDQDPRAACSCPQFADTERCKHVWATLLAMQASAETLAQHGFAVDQAPPRPPRARKRTAGRAAGREGEPPWAGRLSLMRPSGATRQTPGLSLAQRQVCYVVSQTLSHRQSALVVEVRQRHHTPNGWTRPKPLKIDAVTINGFERTIDRELGAWLLGADSVSVDDLDGNTPSERRQSIFAVRPGSRRPLLRRLLQSGCCYLERQGQPLNIESGALTWDESEHGSAWVLWLSGSSGADGLSVRVELRRGARSMDVQTPDLVLAGADGIVIYGNTAASLDDRGATRWLNQFRTEWAVGATVAPIEVPTGDVPRFLDRLYLLPELPEMDLPAGLGRPQRDVEPSPCMELTMPPAGTEQSSNGAASARVWFDYANNQVKPGEPGRLIAVDGDITLIRRDRTRERAVLDTLAPLGFAANPIDEGESLVLPQRHVSTAVSSLIRDGWVLTANERALRRPGMPSFTIQSNVDWFELRGGILYATDKEDQLVGIPQILAAARAGRHTITLNDGSQGLLPEQWINEHGLLASMGQSHRDHLRFQNTQAALLDALVADAQLIDVDAKFDQIRRGLSGFGRIDPAAETERFQGELRPYQRDGLGWIGFLRDIGMGGILADDMGLGKTVQVLAMLEARYGSRASDDGAPSPEGGAGDDAPLDIPGPTLIVVPRSVVFNWIDEAARFAPNLSVQAYTGQDRQLLRDSFADHDVIVTTYGLLRRDVAVLREHDFDYLVLDEAQAIKNPQSQAAKSARLLNASHRLALTGTPVENHLGDVWSIFEYLNPGMLGSGTKFARLIRGDVAGSFKSVFSAPAPSRAGRGGAERRRRAPAHAPERGRRRTGRPGAAALHSEAHQAAGSGRSAGKDGPDALVHHGGRAAKALRPAPEALSERTSGQEGRGRRCGSGRFDVHGARSAVALAPGRLSPGSDRPSACRPAQRQAPDARGATHAARGRRQQVVGLQPIHVHARAGAKAPGRVRHRLRVPGRQDPRSQATDRALPERPGLPRLSDQSQGRRTGT